MRALRVQRDLPAPPGPLADRKARKAIPARRGRPDHWAPRASLGRLDQSARRVRKVIRDSPVPWVRKALEAIWARPAHRVRKATWAPLAL